MTEAAAIAPRLLTREQAAAYCGQSPRGFDRWRKAGIVPDRVPGTARFDRVAIDRAIDALSGEARAQARPAAEPELSPLERFKANRRARRTA